MVTFQRFGWGLRINEPVSPVHSGQPDSVPEAELDFGPEALAAEEEAEAPALMTDGDFSPTPPIAVQEEAMEHSGVETADHDENDELHVEAAEHQEHVADGEAVRADAPAYPGIMQLPDELGALRARVIADISIAEIERRQAATDPSVMQSLAGAWSIVNNAAALGVEPSANPNEAAALRGQAAHFLERKRVDDAINAHADALRRAAIVANMDMLRAMHARLNEGWPK